MPEVVARHLSFQRQFVRAHVHHGDACGILFCACRPPSVGGGEAFQTVYLLQLAFVDGAVPNDGDDQFVLADYSLVRHPVVLGLTVDGAQTGAVGITNPRALWCLAARLPAEDYLARVPGVTLYVAHLEVHGHHGFSLSRREVHLSDATWSSTHVARSEVRGYRLFDG